MSYRSLLAETLNKLSENYKKEEDVLWVGNKAGFICFSWEEFKNISNVIYDSGYGGTYVPEDLVIVGKNWWLEREEYDGAEWWEFKTHKLIELLAQKKISIFKI